LQGHLPASGRVSGCAGGYDTVNNHFHGDARLAAATQRQPPGNKRRIQQRLIQRRRADCDSGHAHRQGERFSRGHHVAGGVDKLQRERDFAGRVDGGSSHPTGVGLDVGGG
jgi:hypothetical protein